MATFNALEHTKIPVVPLTFESLEKEIKRKEDLKYYNVEFLESFFLGKTDVSSYAKIASLFEEAGRKKEAEYLKKAILDELGYNENLYHYDIDFDKDGIVDKIIIGNYSKSDKLYIFKGRKNGLYDLVFDGVNFLYGGLYSVYKVQAEKGKIAFSIDTQFATHGGSGIEYYIAYENSKFILKKIITSSTYWQEDSTKTKFCTVEVNVNLKNPKKFPDPFFSSSPTAPPKDDEPCRIEYYMEKTLSEFILRFEELDNKNIIKDVKRYEVLLKKFPLTVKTLTDYNNIAYYLQKAGTNKEAVYLLEKILEKFPNRTVAYYNLGDAYWELGEKKRAKKAYLTYVEMMKAKGKEKRIPKVVKDRAI